MTSLLRCRDCAFEGTFKAAVGHYRTTRHQLLGSAGPQDLSGFIGSCKQCGCDLAITPTLDSFPHRTHCDKCIFSTVKREYAKAGA